jgi:hypothetical protein
LQTQASALTRYPIVTIAPEPAASFRRHNGMQYTRSGKIGLAVITLTVTFTGVALIAGCSSSGVKGSASSASAALPPSAQHQATGSTGGGYPAAGAGKSAAGSSGGSSNAGGSGQSVSARLAPANQELIYTADLTVRAHDITKATTLATQIVTSVGGYVSNENTSADPANPAQSTASLTLKIPVPSYATTLSQLTSQLGTQTALQQQAQDVTEQVADTNSQVTSAQAAITQLRALLSHAGSVNDLLNVQNQINSEESQLEALQAQQSALNHETTYATVNLTLLGPKAAPPAHHPKAAPGLGRGLTAGWHALRVTVTWTLAVLGAAAPFLVVIALVAYLAYQSRRRLTRRRTHPQPTAPE